MGKQKIIITIEDDIKPELAMAVAKRMIGMGKVSEDTKGNKYYCWATLFDTEAGKVAAYTRKTRNKDTSSILISKWKYEL